MTTATFHLLPNAHLDSVWLWDWREGMNLVPCVPERQLRGSLFVHTPDTA